MSNVKLIRDIGIRDRVNEINKMHEEISVVENNIHNQLDNTKCKIYVLYAKKKFS